MTVEDNTIGYICCGKTAEETTITFRNEAEEITFIEEVMSLPEGPKKEAFVNLLSFAKRRFGQNTMKTAP